jgi:hypothetical protein
MQRKKKKLQAGKRQRLDAHEKRRLLGIRWLGYNPLKKLESVGGDATHSDAKKNGGMRFVALKKKEKKRERQVVTRTVGKKCKRRRRQLQIKMTTCEGGYAS